jgi:hypothetical protein
MAATPFSGVSTLVISGVEPEEHENPTWDEVERAVRNLDGRSTNQVILMVEEDHYLLVGGGENGKVVCEAEVPDGRFMLTDPGQPLDLSVTVMNGQPADYSAQHVVDVGEALEAARYFHSSGSLSNGLRWEPV